MLEKLKAEVCQANLDLVRKGLVIETWGNASGVDRELGFMVIKPSGVPYELLKPEDIVIMDYDAKVVEVYLGTDATEVQDQVHSHNSARAAGRGEGA